MKIVVVSPHRDDAAFSLGLGIAEWANAGHAIEVVNCFTRSEYTPFAEKDFVHANDLRAFASALRQREDVRWARMYRPPVQLTDLNLRDAPQRLQCRVEEVCSVAVRESDRAAPKIAAAICARGGRALLLPLAIGDHVDHLTARVAAIGALEEGWPVAFYEDLPYAARAGAAECIAERVAEVGRALGEELISGFITGPDEVESCVERKRRFALCYDSQIDSQVTEQIAAFCVRYEGRERLWGNGAWRRLHGAGWRPAA